MYQQEFLSCKRIITQNPQISNIQTNILNTLFKTRSKDVKSLSQTTQNLDTNRYKLTISIVDDSIYRQDINASIRSTSRIMYDKINNDTSIQTKSYSDDIISVHLPNLAISNTCYKKYFNTGQSQKELIISSIISYTPTIDELRKHYISLLMIANNNSPFYVPIKVQLSKFDTISEIQIPASNYQRYQKLTCKFTNPYMKSWQVNKIIKFITTDINDIKLTKSLTSSNILDPKSFDVILIEFEYIGNFNDIYEQIFRLFEYIYDDFRVFSVKYNILKCILSIEPTSLISTPTLTSINTINDEDVEKSIIKYHYNGDHLLLIIYDSLLIEIGEYSFKVITNDINKLKISEISSILMKYTNTKINDNINISLMNPPMDIMNGNMNESTSMNNSMNNINNSSSSLTIFDVIKLSTNQYVVNDILSYDSYILIDSMKYLSRLALLFDTTCIYNKIIKPIKLNIPQLINNPLTDKQIKPFIKTNHKPITTINDLFVKMATLDKIQLDDSIDDDSIDDNLIDDSIDSINNNSIHDPLSNELTDGIILHQSNEQKLIKKIINHTIKCLLIYDDQETNMFLIYVKGNANDIIKPSSIYNKYTTKHFGKITFNDSNDNILLFDCPYYESFVTENPNGISYAITNNRKYFITDNINFDDEYDYPELINKQSNSKIIYHLLTEMFTHPTKYDRKYAAITLTPYGWVPISIDLTKNTHINHNNNNYIIDNYITALNIISVLYQTNYDTICKHSTYKSLVDYNLNTFNIDKNHLNELTSIYKLTNNIMTKYIIEKLFTDTMHTIIDISHHDLAVTGDEIQSISCINNIYLTSLNESIITEYTQSMLNKTAKHHLFTQVDKSKNKLVDKFVNMNIIKSNFNNYSSLMNKILSIPDYKLKCIDTIFVQNSVEIFSSIINLLTFLKFSSEVLSPRGNIIIKNYDMDDINILRDKMKNVKFDNSNDVHKDNSSKEVKTYNRSSRISSTNRLSSRISSNRSINKNTQKYSKTLKHIKIITIDDIQQRCIAETNAINKIYQSKPIHSREHLFNKLTSLNLKEVDLYYDIAVNGLYISPYIKNEEQLISRNDDNYGIYFCMDEIKGISLENNDIIMIALAKSNMTNDYGQLLSHKLLTRTQTWNLHLLLSINTELSTNMFDRLLPMWFSNVIYSIDNEFGSCGNTDRVYELNQIIDDNILLESIHLSDKCLNYIKNNRFNCEYSTIIVTTDEIPFMTPIISNHEQKLISTDECVYVNSDPINIYVILPKWISNDEKYFDIIKSMIESIMNNKEDNSLFIIDILEHPSFENNVLSESYILTSIGKSIMIDMFTFDKSMSPLKEYDLIKYITANKSFTNINLIEPFMSSVRFDKYVVKCDE